jgi:hypothetical protein
VPQGPTLACGEAAACEPDDLSCLRASFRGRTRLALGQAWLTSPEPGLRAGSVKTAWRAQSLLVLAELDDDDVFSRATGANQRFWELGDCFEMFLEAPGAGFYVELQVTPANHALQLRVPIPRPKAEPETLMVAASLFSSRTWNEARHWAVYAEIPFAATGGRPARFSFSRYDYTRGKPPVLSSTSPHAAVDFHRREEWGTLEFA